MTVKLLALKSPFPFAPRSLPHPLASGSCQFLFSALPKESSPSKLDLQRLWADEAAWCLMKQHLANTELAAKLGQTLAFVGTCVDMISSNASLRNSKSAFGAPE